jgi:hypothetical protein
MEFWRGKQVRVRHGPWTCLSAAALTAWLAMPALAQDNVVATATLPRDLSPWGMYLNADPVVKAVLIGLAFASLVTWTVWLAKSIEIFFAKRRVRHRASCRHSGRGRPVPRRGRDRIEALSQFHR